MCVRNLCALLFSLLSPALFAQRGEVTYLMPYHLSISDHHTSNLIFPFAIKSADRGSRDVVIQKAKGVENILQVKAITVDFTPTNLSIITSDGKFYSIVVVYEEKPPVLNVFFKPVAVDEIKAQVSGQILNEVLYNQIRDSIDKMPGFTHKKVRKQKMELTLHGIYLKDDAMFFELSLLNKTSIKYPIASLRFFIRDRKQAKRTAMQETEVFPLFELPRLLIAGCDRRPVSIGFKAFTLPPNKELIIQLREESGARTVELKISAGLLLRAKQF